MGKKILVNKDLVYREEDGDALLFNPEAGSVKILNRCANLIWKLCDGTRTRNQIAGELVKNFPATKKEVLEKDLDEFLARAEELSLISFVE